MVVPSAHTRARPVEESPLDLGDLSRVTNRIEAGEAHVKNGSEPRTLMLSEFGLGGRPTPTLKSHGLISAGKNFPPARPFMSSERAVQVK
jgi:hypothetical protein